MRNHNTLLVLMLLFVACDGGSSTSPEDVPVALTTVVKASYSGSSAPVRTVVRGNEEWVDAWQTLHAGLNPVPPVPPVDFDREMLVLVAAGTRSNGCFAIEITGASLKPSGELELEVTETVPGPACACTEALTQPVHVVKLARLPGPETYLERRSELRC